MPRNSFLLFIVPTLVLVLSCARSSNGDIRKECRRDSKVSWGALRRLKSGDLEQDDPRLKCYLKCFMMRNGIVDERAEVDVERALRHLPRSYQDSSRTLLDRCKNMNGTDPCDKAYQMVKCYVVSRPEILQNVPFL